MTAPETFLPLILYSPASLLGRANPPKTLVASEGHHIHVNKMARQLEEKA
jgi:hypothetical protein